MSSGDHLITSERHRQCNTISNQSAQPMTDSCDQIVRKTFLMCLSQAQFTEAKQAEEVSTKLGVWETFFSDHLFGVLIVLIISKDFYKQSTGRIRFSDSPGQPIIVDAKLDDFDLERAAGKGKQWTSKWFWLKTGYRSESVWLDLGGGMEPDDQGWEAIIQSLRHDPSLEQWVNLTRLGRWHDNATLSRADPGYRQLEVEDLTEEGTSKKQKPAKLSGGSLRVMGGPKQRWG